LIVSTYPIREARPDDLEGVYALLSLADHMHRQAHPEIFQEAERPAEVKDYLLASIRAEDAVVFIAKDGSEIIGAILAWVRQPREIPVLIPRGWVSVENLVVAGPYRHLGVGQALMERVHLWAEERGLKQIQLTVWEFNQDAIEFYEKLGYEMLHHRMRKELP
jgi:ribosomal protein S18 acetylase RimI-like enzyme